MILAQEHLVLLASLQVAMKTEIVISPRYLCRLYPYMLRFFENLNMRDRYSLLYALNRHPKREEIRNTLYDYIDQWTGLGDISIGDRQKKMPMDPLKRAIRDICRKERLLKNGRMKHKGWNKLFHLLKATGIPFQPNSVRAYVTKSLLSGDNT